MVFVQDSPWFFQLWGLPFVLVGLYMIFGRFWVDARQRARTFYGITSERVVIVFGLFARRVKSLSIDTLTDVSLTERSGGSGTITLCLVPPPFYGWYSGSGWPGFPYQTIPILELPAEAREVYEIIRRAQRAARVAYHAPGPP